MLPNPNQDALPSARIKMQQEGMDPSKDIPVGGHHPTAANKSTQVEDMMRSIESRFSNILSPSNFAQAGLFNTLGNNPVTQMISGAGGALGDIWDSLLSTGDEKDKARGDAKDPLTALNKHTKLLGEIVDALDDLGDAVKFMAYDQGKPRPSKKKGAEPGGDDRSRAHEENKKILKDLEKTKGDISEKLKTATGEEKDKLEKQLKATEAAMESMERTVAKGEKHATPKEGDVGIDKNLRATDAAIEAMERRAKESGSEEHQKMLDDLKKTREDLVQKKEAFDPDKTIHTTVDQLERDATKEVSDKNRPFDPDKTVHTTVGQLEKDAAAKGEKSPTGKKEGKGFFTEMFDKLGLNKASSAIEQFSKTMKRASGELSKSFGQTAKAAKKKSQPLVDAIKGSETGKLLKAGAGAAGGLMSQIAQGATSPAAAMATGQAPPQAIADAIEAGGVQPDPSALDAALDVASAASDAKDVGSVLKGGAKKAAGWLGKGIQGVKSFAGSNAGKLAGKAAAVIGAGTASYNAISEEAAGKHIESAGDIVPEGMNKINPFDWIQRGARYAGNKLNKGYEAVSGASLGSDIYDRFNKDPMASGLESAKIPSRASAIESTKSSIEDAKTSGGKASQDTVIGAVNNNVNQNTTILPSRTSVTNNDSSFNRYVSRSMRY